MLRSWWATDVYFHGQVGTADEDRCGGVSGGNDDDVNALSLDGAPPSVAGGRGLSVSRICGRQRRARGGRG